MNINRAESLNLDSSQTVQAYSALFSSGLLEARLTVLKMLLELRKRPYWFLMLLQCCCAHFSSRIWETALGKATDSCIQGCRGKAACSSSAGRAWSSAHEQTASLPSPGSLGCCRSHSFSLQFGVLMMLHSKPDVP